jgi:hypothetical protein
MYRVLVVQIGTQWLAQCVDFDLSAQGPSDALAVAAFLKILRAHYLKDRQLGREPFDNLPEAPARFAKAWDRIARTSSRVISAEEDGDEMPPAYIVEAIQENNSDSNVGQ